MKTRYTLLFSLVVFTVTLAGQVQIGATIEGREPAIQFGRSTSISGDGTRIAIGAPFRGADNDGPTQVVILEESGGAWTQVGADISSSASGGQFGLEVSLSEDGRRVAIGAPFAGTEQDGEVQIFEENGGAWTQLGNTFTGSGNDDLLGFSVALSADGRRVVIAAAGVAGPEQVRIFAETGGVWTQVGAGIAPDPEIGNFAPHLAISADGRRVAIGSVFQNGGSINGQVQIFAENGGTWTQVGTSLGVDETDSFFTGFDVALSAAGDRVAFTKLQRGSMGLVSVYAEAAGTWTQVGTDIARATSTSSPGAVVSLSASGRQLAFGLPFNADAGTDAGLASFYEEIGGTWTQLGTDVLGAGVDDLLGTSIALSADARRVVIGAPESFRDAAAIGRVLVFDISALLPVQLSRVAASAEKHAARIDWQTASEAANAGFAVEHSTDGHHWREIGFVAGRGTPDRVRDYTFQHATPAPGTNYYRLQQRDFDGTVAYSEVVSVHFGGAADCLRVSPNPVGSSQAAAVLLPAELVGEPLAVYGATGRLVRVLPTTTRRISLAGLPAGRYVVRAGSLTQWLIVE